MATYSPSAEVASAVAALLWCSHVASAGAGCSLAGSAASRQPSLNWYARSAPSAHAAKKERPPGLLSASPAGTGASASAADSMRSALRWTICGVSSRSSGGEAATGGGAMRSMVPSSHATSSREVPAAPVSSANQQSAAGRAGSEAAPSRGMPG